MDKEKVFAVSKGLLYFSGVVLIICGLVLLAIIKAGSGSIFPQSGETAFIYIIAYGAIVGGVVFIYRGTKYADEEEAIRALPTTEVRARVLEIYRYTDGRVEVTFETESEEYVKLWQVGSFRYFEGDVGKLRYKDQRVVDFLWEEN